jgi:GH25 family lysozyme M1 (1,4-beta-N-acetylmuramidase)
MSRPRHGKQRKRATFTMAVIAATISLGVLVGLGAGTFGPLFDASATAYAYPPSLVTPNRDSPVPSGLIGPAKKARFWGLDVSDLQHPSGAPVDWKLVHGAGARYVFLQAGGYGWDNTYYRKDARQAAATGLDVIPYYYAGPKGSATQEADSAVQLAGYESQSATSPLALDIEVAPKKQPKCYSKTPAQLAAWIGQFLAEVKHQTGRTPIIYTNEDFWGSCIGAANSTPFRGYPLWFANYVNSPPLTMPAGLTTNWDFWQWTSTAFVPGIADAVGHTRYYVDLDVFNPKTVVLTDPPAQHRKAGTAVRLTVDSLNARAGYGSTLQFSAKKLPPGLTITGSGTITGTPTTPGTYHSTITASSNIPAAGQHSDTMTLTWIIAPGPVKPKPKPKPSRSSTSAAPPASATPTPTPPASVTPTPTPPASNAPTSTPAASSPTTTTPSSSPASSPAPTGF